MKLKGEGMIDRFLLGGRWLLVVVCLGVAVGCSPSADERGVTEAGAVTTATFENIRVGMSIDFRRRRALRLPTFTLGISGIKPLTL